MNLFEGTKLSEVKKDYKEFKNDVSKKISEDLSEELQLKRILQMLLGNGKEITAGQITFKLKNAKWEEKVVNLTWLSLWKGNIGFQGTKWIKLMADAPVEEFQGYKLTTPSLNKKTDEYKSKELNLWENKLLVKEKTVEKAKEIMNKFLNLFKDKLNEAIRLYKENSESDYTRPVMDLFRPYTMFKGTVFGKQGVWYEYAKKYFERFVQKFPTGVILNELVDFAFTEDGLVAKWDYTFFTENKGEIKWSFLMVIWEDDKWMHFKVFHSAAKNSVIA